MKLRWKIYWGLFAAFIVGEVLNIKFGEFSEEGPTFPWGGVLFLAGVPIVLAFGIAAGILKALK